MNWTYILAGAKGARHAADRMHREIGSFGKDVAKGLGDTLDLKLQHHEIIDHLPNRARRKKPGGQLP